MTHFADDYTKIDEHDRRLESSGDSSAYRADRKVKSITEVPMKCEKCGSIFPLGECDAVDAYDLGPDYPYDGEIGCPVADCGGIMQEHK